MSLSKRTQQVLNVALADNKATNEIVGVFGVAGGFQLHNTGVVYNETSDFVVIDTTSTAAHTYRIEFAEAINAKIKSIGYFNVNGFTPRAPGSNETCAVRVTGYSKDATGKWYITIQITDLSGDLQAPTEGFVIGCQAQLAFSTTVPL